MVFLVRAANEYQKKHPLKAPAVENPTLIALRQAEERFEHQIEERIGSIEQKISKTLFRLNARLAEERKKATENLNQAKAFSQQKSAPKAKYPLSPSSIPSVQVAQKHFEDVTKLSAQLGDILHIKHNVRVFEEKVLWLRKRGYDSAAISSLEQRLHAVKEELYTKIATLLEALPKKH